MCLLTVSARFGYRKWPNWAKMSKKQRFIETWDFQGCFFVTDGRWDLGIGSYEMSWRLNMPFDSFGQIRPLKMADFDKNVQKQRFVETFAFPGCFFVSDGRWDLGIGSNEMSSRVGVPFGSFGHIGLPEFCRIWLKLPKTANFLNMSFSRLYLCNVWS